MLVTLDARYAGRQRDPQTLMALGMSRHPDSVGMGVGHVDDRLHLLQSKADVGVGVVRGDHPSGRRDLDDAGSPRDRHPGGILGLVNAGHDADKGLGGQN